MTNVTVREVQANPPRVASADKVSLNIPAQPVETALIEFSRQTGIHVMVYSDYAKDITCPRLQGMYTPARALDELLAHTGLRYEYLDPQSVAVFSIERSSSSSLKMIAAVTTTASETPISSSDSAASVDDASVVGRELSH
jgi:hypothetical protein